MWGWGWFQIMGLLNVIWLKNWRDARPKVMNISIQNTVEPYNWPFCACRFNNLSKWDFCVCIWKIIVNTVITFLKRQVHLRLLSCAFVTIWDVTGSLGFTHTWVCVPCLSVYLCQTNVQSRQQKIWSKLHPKINQICKNAEHDSNLVTFSRMNR